MPEASIVHIATDEKFINAAYEVYEQVFPGRNLFIILLNDKDEKIKHLSSDKSYIFVYLNEDYCKQVNTKIIDAEYVVFHGMDRYQAKIALSVNSRAKLVWSVFGIEIYNNPYVNINIYGPETNKIIRNYKDFLKNRFRPFYNFFLSIKYQENPFESKLKAFKKMDLVAISFEEQFSFYKEKGLLKEQTEWFKFYYYPLDVIINTNGGFVTGENILVGNSSTPANNHLEVFNTLRAIPIGERKIITPISYGSIEYGSTIKKIGYSLFHNNFEPLINFLALREYQKIVQTCGIVIMNHYRQQAFGNILTSLFMGGKVFLSEKNKIYNYLKRIGCIVFSIENDLKNGVEPLKLLTMEEMRQNRRIISKEISMSNIKENLEQTFNLTKKSA